MTSRKAPTGGEAEASSSGSGDGSSEPSSPTGSESEERSSDYEFLQEKLAGSTGPSHPEARIDPKPGGVKPRELYCAANCGFTLTKLNREQPIKRGVRMQPNLKITGWLEQRAGACQSFKEASSP